MTFYSREELSLIQKIMKLFICLQVSQSLIYMKMLFIVLMESSWDGLKMVG